METTKIRVDIMENHKCSPLTYCTCHALAEEPKDDCPVHGFETRRRCSCGKYCSSAETDIRSVKLTFIDKIKLLFGYKLELEVNKKNISYFIKKC